MVYCEYTDKKGQRVEVIFYADKEPLLAAKQVAQQNDVSVTLREMRGTSTQYDPVVGVVDRFGNIS